MATDSETSLAYAALLDDLEAPNWAGVLVAVSAADAWLRVALPGDPKIDDVVSKLVLLAGHPKWEVRRGVANAAAQALHPAFHVALSKLLTDDNSRVRQAAEHATSRRRDWQNASMLGKQHEDRINSTLDDIEVRFGPKGRDAVKRAGEQMANTFARELYHEVIKLISPIAASADRLRTRLLDEKTTRADLAGEAERIESRVNHLRSVLDAMRIYTAQPKLTFTMDPMKDIVEEAVALIRDGRPSKGRQPHVIVEVDATLSAEVSRARLVQALTNVVANAVEAYDGLDTSKPILVRADAAEGHIAISVEDSGCGMSKEVLADATVLFATSKSNGTGFGLPLAIKIVESEHGGRLTLESVKGRGSVVRVVIPVHRQRDSA